MHDLLLDSAIESHQQRYNAEVREQYGLISIVTICLKLSKNIVKKYKDESLRKLPGW